jgi:hypothetical protein
MIPLARKPAKPATPSRPNALLTLVKNQEASRLTRELWDTRRVLSAARARELTIKKNIELLTCGQSVVVNESKTSAPRGTFPVSGP